MSSEASCPRGPHLGPGVRLLTGVDQSSVVLRWSQVRHGMVGLNLRCAGHDCFRLMSPEASCFCLYLPFSNCCCLLCRSTALGCAVAVRVVRAILSHGAGTHGPRRGRGRRARALSRAQDPPKYLPPLVLRQEGVCAMVRGASGSPASSVLVEVFRKKHATHA